MEDREFMTFLNMCSIYEIEDLCKQYNAEIVLEDGRITNYIVKKGKNNE